MNLVKKVADGVSIPFAVGGGIVSMEDVQAILDAGADKVSLNSAAVRTPEILAEISNEFGSERLVCAIDGNRVYSNPDWAGTSLDKAYQYVKENEHLYIEED